MAFLCLELLLVQLPQPLQHLYLVVVSEEMALLATWVVAQFMVVEAVELLCLEPRQTQVDVMLMAAQAAVAVELPHRRLMHAMVALVARYSALPVQLEVQERTVARVQLQVVMAT